jgi:hypothetical protein
MSISRRWPSCAFDASISSEPRGWISPHCSKRTDLKACRCSTSIAAKSQTRSDCRPRCAGLSRALTWVRVSATNPEEVRRELALYLRIDPDDLEASPVVYEPSDFVRPTVEWEIDEPVDTAGWSAYGSLLRHEGAMAESTEDEACERAEARLRAADAWLAARVDFDPESAGTGIYAPTREDLEQAMQILGLR